VRKNEIKVHKKIGECIHGKMHPEKVAHPPEKACAPGLKAASDVTPGKQVRFV
jgi:hypothetical protein